MTRRQELRQRAAHEAWLRNSPSEEEIERIDVAPTPSATRQERLFFALLGGCLGLTLVASAMLRLMLG